MASTQPSRYAQSPALNYTLVTETFPPEINGVSMTLGRLVAGLEAKRINVTVIAPARKDRNPEGNHQLIEVTGLPIPRYSELRFGLPAFNRIRRLWASDPPDLVHIATEGPLGWSALRIARKLNIPVVSSFHTNFHSYGQHYGFGLLQPVVLGWLRRFHNRTLRTFVPSDDLIKRLSADRFKRLRLLARGVDTRLFGPHQRSEELRKNWGAGPDTPVVLYVGRLAGEKNLDLVADGFEQIQHILPDAVLVLVGDGPHRVRLQHRIPEARFEGMQTGQALAARYASADTFLFASITETFGNVVTEAMASALPVLAYDYAAAGRFINSGVNGLLVPFDESDKFKAQATQLARIRPNWKAMGAAARETMLPHSWESVISGYISEVSPLARNSHEHKKIPKTRSPVQDDLSLGCPPRRTRLPDRENQPLPETH